MNRFSFEKIIFKCDIDCKHVLMKTNKVLSEIKINYKHYENKRYSAINTIKNWDMKMGCNNNIKKLVLYHIKKDKNDITRNNVLEILLELKYEILAKICIKILHKMKGEKFWLDAEIYLVSACLKENNEKMIIF